MDKILEKKRWVFGCVIAAAFIVFGVDESPNAADSMSERSPISEAEQTK